MAMTIQGKSSGKRQPAGVRTAVLVMNSGQGPKLCPLFAKCDGVLLIERDGSTSFHPNTERTAQFLSELVRAIGADRLVCSFIGNNAFKASLRLALTEIKKAQSLRAYGCSQIAGPTKPLVAVGTGLPRYYDKPEPTP